MFRVTGRMSTGGYKYMASAISPAAATSADTEPAADDAWGKIYPVDPDLNWGCPFDIQEEVLCETYTPVRVEYVPDAACYITPTRLVIPSPPKAPAKRIRKPVKRYGFE